MIVLISLIFIILSVIGLCDVIHYFYMILLRTKYSGSKILICTLDGKCPELDLKYVLEQQEWYGNKFADKIVAVCVDDRDISICKSMAELNNIIIVNKECLSEYILTEL